VSIIGRAECDLKMALLYGAPKRHHDREAVQGLDIIAMFSSAPLGVEFYADVRGCIVGQIRLSLSLGPRRGSIRRMDFQLREAHLHFPALTARLFKFMAQDIQALATSLDHKRIRIADHDLALWSQQGPLARAVAPALGHGTEECKHVLVMESCIRP